VTSPSATIARAPEINFTFSAYTAGKFRVGDPFRWSLAGLTANVSRKGGVPDAPEVADPARPQTWFPANQAFPASAQVGGE
jgi:hypothetical protein